MRSQTPLILAYLNTFLCPHSTPVDYVSLFSRTHRHACCGIDSGTPVNSIIVAREREVLLTQFFGEAVTRPPRGPMASPSVSEGLAFCSYSAVLPGREQMALCCLPLTLPPPPLAFAQPDSST